MGDHWLGEKDLFHDCSARVPLIISDPRPQASSNHGTVSEKLVEAIDLAPTFMEFFGIPSKPHIIEGQSLQSLLFGEEPSEWRQFCVSEYDYSTRDARCEVGVDQSDARLVMIFDGRWKYVHVEKMRPLLFDLETDPNELIDLGADVAYADHIERMSSLHFQWARKHHNRITRSAGIIEKMAVNREPPGILIAYNDKEELEAEEGTLPSHVFR